MNLKPVVYRIFIVFVLAFLLVSCAERHRTPVDPTSATPPLPGSKPGTGIATPPPQNPTPAPPPPESSKPPRPVPQPQPRQPAKGDAASAKLVTNGVKMLNTGNLDQAEQMFEQALRVSPSNGKPYYYLGIIAAKQKDYERSLSFLGQAETYLKDDDFWLSQVLLQEGLSLKALGRKDEARQRLQEALRRDATNKAAEDALKKP